MKLRVARHTDDLAPLIHFYVDLIGLEFLGEFKDHQGYDGCFIGRTDSDWHLEFTTSKEMAQHSFDLDDLLVLYIEEERQFQAILSRLYAAGIETTLAKNPYWNSNGKIFIDPDGFHVVLSQIKQED